MPHRRLVRIGETPALPTIAQFLTEMASRQHEEIERLKREAMEHGVTPHPMVAEATHDELTPDPWLLHPVRIKKASSKRKKSAKKAAKKTSKRAKPASRKQSKSTRKVKKSAAKRR